jgi:hypothetical protein
MDGQCMQNAIKALELFIKSLPNGCTFNVYSFGSIFSKLWNESRSYTNDNVNSCLNEIKKYTANMNGTEILKPIQDILSSQTTNNRCCFLITDGNVSDHKTIIDYIRNHKQSTRFFTLGIGRSDFSLLEKIADIADGSFNQVNETSDIGKAVIKLLDLSCKEYYRDIKVSFVGENCPFSVNGSTVFPNKPFYMLCQMDTDRLEDIIISLTDSTGSVYDESIQIPKNNADCMIKQFYGNAMINDLINDTGYYEQKEKITEQKERDDLITALSLSFGIMCKHTSFVIVDDIPLDTNNQITVNVPQWNSHKLPQTPQELAQLFNSLDVVVREQGFVMDRIDYNVECCSAEVYSIETLQRSSHSTSRRERASRSRKVEEGESLELASASIRMPSHFSNFISSVKNFFSKKSNNSSSSSSSTSVKIESKTLLDYMAVDGSFAFTEEVMQLIGMSKKQINKLNSLPKNEAMKQFHELILEYLKDKNDVSYVRVIKKLEEYIKTL